MVRVVKGVSFVNLRDAGDPVEVAAIYDREGADELCFLDITASHENRKPLLMWLNRRRPGVFMPVTVGGGVRTLDDIARCSMPVPTKSASTRRPFQQPSLFVKLRNGSAPSASSWPSMPSGRKPADSGRSIRMVGGRRPDWMRWSGPSALEGYGAGEIPSPTSMDQDGRQNGYDLELTAAVSARLSIPVIASGGGYPRAFI